jgi:hypothetical protein
MDSGEGENDNADVCHVSASPCFILPSFYVISGLDAFPLLSVEEDWKLQLVACYCVC